MRTRSIAAATLLTVGLVGATARAEAAGSGRTTLRLHFQQTALTYVDLGPKGFGAGDEFDLAGVLTKNGVNDGRLGAHCFVTEPTLTSCAVNLNLREGEITAQGLVPVATARPRFVVTGGSAAYRGAVGEVDVHQLSRNSFDYTVSLGR